MDTYDHVYKVNMRVIIKDGATDMRNGPLDLRALTARKIDTMNLRRLGSEATRLDRCPGHRRGSSSGRLCGTVIIDAIMT